jgi:GalNAc-alpha-(1->4)-GalNAc-alpha-(1->3)-diNAcBac-PP-undecaprenol alpha-1,4-N-acetyl-D-galactosaminyltransferase
MKKIMFITGSMGRGGGERVISILSEHFNSIGCETHIVMLLEFKCEYKLSDDIVLHDLTPRSGAPVIKKLIKWMSGIRRLVQEIKPDTVVSFFGRINAITLFSCIGLRQRIVVSERSNPRLDTRGKLGRMACRLAYLLPCNIVFQTKYQRNYFGRMYARKSMIIPNPVANIEKKNIPTEHSFIMAGRLVESKNYFLAIDAFLLFASSYPGYHLDIYGDGELKDQLMMYIIKHNAQGYIMLHPTTADIHDYFARAECFVLSSDYEGMSNSLLEAMTMGMACVSTAWDGVDEVLRNGHDGLIIPVGDVKALAAAFAQIADDQELATKIRKNARCSAKRFSYKVVISQWSRIIIGE